MTNSTRHFASITSFISHATSIKQLRFPQQQIADYCKQNECSLDKIANIYQAYYEKFKWNYDNFNQITVLLSIALKKIQTKSNKNFSKTEVHLMLKKSLTFLQDLITSKMILVCITSKNKQKSIAQHYVYAQGFITLLVPQLLDFDFHPQILTLIQNCNNPSRPQNLIVVNFLIEAMFIMTTTDFLNEESAKDFKPLVLDLLEDKKKIIINCLWNAQKLASRKIQFKEITYSRRDIETPEINHLQISEDGKITINSKNSSFCEQWISEAYQKQPNQSVWKSLKVKNVVEIYQFLFKLQVFASSPLIEQLDALIPNSEEFIDLFSKFLMGETLIEKKQSKRQGSSDVVKNIFEIKKLYDKTNKAQKLILKRELSKMFSETNSQQDQENESNTQIEMGR